MSAFTPGEITYLQSQFLGRLATVGADNQPHVVPVTFRYNPDLDTIDIGGQMVARRKKYRDVLHNPKVALVVDDWELKRGRGIEIRGIAQVLETGGKGIYPDFDDEMFRIRPVRIISWGVEGETFSINARSIS